MPRAADHANEMYRNSAIIPGFNEYAYESGTGGATVTPPANSRVQKISGYASGGDGTITIVGGNTITVRSGGSFSEEINGNIRGDATKAIVFSATMDYFVSWFTK